MVLAAGAMPLWLKFKRSEGSVYYLPNCLCLAFSLLALMVFVEGGGGSLTVA